MAEGSHCGEFLEARVSFFEGRIKPCGLGNLVLISRAISELSLDRMRVE